MPIVKNNRTKEEKEKTVRQSWRDSVTPKAQITITIGSSGIGVTKQGSEKIKEE